MSAPYSSRASAIIPAIRPALASTAPTGKSNWASAMRSESFMGPSRCGNGPMIPARRGHPACAACLVSPPRKRRRPPGGGLRFEPSGTARLLHQLGDGRAQVARRTDGLDASGFHRGELAFRGALAAGSDRTGMAHALAGRGRGTGDEADDRLLDVLGDVLGAGFLGVAADLADHDDAFGLRVLVEQLEAVDEVQAVDRVASNTDAGRLAQAHLGGLLDRFIGQGARTRDDADLARLVDVARHDADLALARGDDAGA